MKRIQQFFPAFILTIFLATVANAGEPDFTNPSSGEVAYSDAAGRDKNNELTAEQLTVVTHFLKQYTAGWQWVTESPASKISLNLKYGDGRTANLLITDSSSNKEDSRDVVLIRYDDSGKPIISSCGVGCNYQYVMQTISLHDLQPFLDFTK